MHHGTHGIREANGNGERQAFGHCDHNHGHRYDEKLEHVDELAPSLGKRMQRERKICTSERTGLPYRRQ